LRASDACMRRALDWLARHRTKDGGWTAIRGGHDRRGAIAPEGEPAFTALALLCYLCADHGPDEEGQYRDLVRDALALLMADVGPSGLVNGRYSGYHQGIVLLALSEGLARSEKNPPLRAAVERLVECMSNSQDPTGGGWRYSPKDAGDTSVTCWVLLGLKSAEHAGVPVPPSVWAGARRYVEAVSTSRPGYTEYMPSYSERRDAAFDSLGMHATGLFLRVMFGESPASPRNQIAAKVCMQVPVAIKETMDRYAVYYAALAMYQVGGPLWRELNPQLRDGVVAAQRRESGCEDGCWSDDTRWMNQDLVLSTCFATLTLETYYRYLPVHGDDGVSGTVDTGISAGEKLLLDAGALFAEAQQSNDASKLLAAEARYEEAIAALDSAASAPVAARAEPDAAARDDASKRAPVDQNELARAEQNRQAWSDLAQQARGGLVEVAAAGLESAQVVVRADAYLAALRHGARPDPQVLRLRRLALAELAMERAGAAVRQGSPGGLETPAKRLADETLVAAIAACRVEAEGASATVKADVELAAAALERVRRRLTLVLTPDAGIADAQASLPRPDAGKQMAEEERAVVDAVAFRAQHGYADAARLKDAAAFEKAEADAAWLERREVGRRLPVGDRPDWVDAERALAWSRLVALVRLELERASIEQLQAFRLRWPAERVDELLALERALLLRRVAKDVALPAERARLLDLLVEWVDKAPAKETDTPWAGVAELLLDAGMQAQGERALDRALDGALTEEQMTRATLLRARLRRLRGLLAEAGDDLTALDRLGHADRVDVRLERCALLRAQGKGSEALGRYEVIVRALGVERPTPWWEAVEGTAQTYLELGLYRQARDYLDGVIRRDRTFGGSTARADRFAKLMIKAGAGR
jgi:hypothetical protein